MPARSKSRPAAPIEQAIRKILADHRKAVRKLRAKAGVKLAGKVRGKYPAALAKGRSIVRQSIARFRKVTRGFQPLPPGRVQ
jgi:hypothetical protein